MSARKLDQPTDITPSSHPKIRLSLSAKSVHVRKSGLEFRATDPIPAWTEMSIDLQYPDSKKVHCNGVVVECEGNRHSGYLVSFLFTKLSRQSQTVLSALEHA